ncbi:MAG TPA: hypothetical protein VK470_18080 [Bacteroidota bacterium]|nr:hypothetical protein [Bacteroidota bacterium]
MKTTWTQEERVILSRLKSPIRIQEYLDTLEYSSESRYRSPRSVMRDTKGHCFDGAVFAAAALRMLGYRPLIVDMQAVRDDDHVIAVYRKAGCWGAVAKSNFAGLRFREPIHKNVRELVMSYFESFYNLNREKTLRKFSRPLDLSAYDRYDWMVNDEAMELIGTKLCYISTSSLLTPAMIRGLQPVDQRAYEAGMHGANPAGLYNPNADAKK